MPALIAKVAALQNLKEYEELNWEGSFEDYLAIVRENPQVTRNAFQRVYDMILSYGQEEYIDNKKKLIRYNFFKDEQHGGRDAIFGLDIPLMRLVNVLKRRRRATAPRSASSCCTARSARRSRRSRACSRRASRTTRARPTARSTRSTGRCPRSWRTSTGGQTTLPVPDARGAAAPHPAGVARDGARRARPRQRASTACTSTATSIRPAASSSSELMAAVRRRLGQGDASTSACGA